jgi:tetratricopeptide (TPR) repeat protein
MSQTENTPYPGSRPFRSSDSHRFFGRGDDARILAEVWRDNRLTVLSGPVGSGKTSLLEAGVFPLIRRARLDARQGDQPPDVLPPGRLSRGATFPFATLPDHNAYTLALLRSWSPDEAATALGGLTVHDFVCRRAGRHDGILLAAIDQMEDLQADSGPRKSHRQQFLRELASALSREPRLHLLLVVREETVDLVSEELGHGASYALGALTRDHAIMAVRNPVVGTGRVFTDEAAEKLVTDLQVSRIAVIGDAERVLHAQDVEPALLQVVCARLWQSLPQGTDVITPREVRAYGDADAALAAYWGRNIAAIADEHDLTARRLRTWLVGNFVSGAGTRQSVVEVGGATAGLPSAVVRAFAGRYLVSAAMCDGVRQYKLLSPRLIEPLRQAVDEPPPPTVPTCYLDAAEQALTLGELDLAEHYARLAVQASPDTDIRLRAEVTSLLGNVEYEREKPGMAEARYRQAADLFQVLGDTRAVARLLAAVGQTLVAQEQYAAALNELHAAVNRMSNEPDIQTELALALWQLGDGRAAVAVLTDVLGIDGGNVEALRVRGEILAYLGDARKAMFDLDRVASEGEPLVLAARGLALAELGDQSAARQEIDRVVDDTTRNGTVLLYAARARALTGDVAEAKELANRAVDATDPALPPPRRDAALALAGRGPDQALPR